jgi:signal transduction histidine kinase
LLDVIQDAIAPWRLKAEAKTIQLIETMPTNVSGESVRVLGDRQRLQQIISNLLSNAIKFTPEGGRVGICWLFFNNYAQIQIKDNGIGINADFLPYVFARFRQAEVPSRHSPGGVGIGLAIARHLVELHGGIIEVASDGQGQGATFTVRLPLV